MKIKFLVFAVVLLATAIPALSQTVVVTDDNSYLSGDASSVLDVKSTSKGILVPRVTSAQRTAITSPATGLLVYQTDGTAGFYFYNGSTWTAIASGTTSQWQTIGNTGSTAANFLGTTDNVSLRVRTNGTQRIIVDSVGQVGIGLAAPTALLHIRGNNPLTLIGVQAGAATDSMLTITNGVVKKLPIGVGTAGNWSLSGNTSATAANFLGTTDAVSMRFRTNNAERVIFDSVGQVGIGLSAPTALLHIRGNNPLTLIGVQGGAATDSMLTITNGVVKKLPMGAGTAGHWSLTGNTSATAANFIGTTDAVSMRIRTNNTERVIVDSVGQVGIGLSAPTALLHIRGNNPLTLIGVQGGAATDSMLTITNGVVKKLPMGAGTAGHWSLTGNTSATAANFIGTTDQVSLRFRTNNTERVIVDSVGQVGIGLSAPTALLHIRGNNPLTLIGVQAGAATDSVLTITNGVVKKLPMGAGTAGLWSLNGNTSATAANFIGTTDQVSLRFRTNNTERVIVDSVGQVGIGLSAPTALLHIRGNNPLTLIGVQAGAATDSVLTITNGIVKKLPMGAGTAGLWSVTGNASTTPAANFMGTTDNVSLRFRTNNTQKVIIDSVGQVGIGVDAPTASLHIVGSTPLKLFGLPLGDNSDSVLTIDGGTVQKISISTGSNGLWSLRGNGSTIASTNFIGTTDNLSMRFRTNNTQRAIIDSVGQVGIGTAAPTATLDVAGTVKLGTSGTKFTNMIKTSITVTNTTNATTSAPQSVTATVTGAQLNATVIVNPRADLVAPLAIMYCYVSATNTVKIVYGSTNGNHALGTSIVFDVTVINP